MGTEKELSFGLVIEEARKSTPIKVCISIFGLSICKVTRQERCEEEIRQDRCEEGQEEEQRGEEEQEGGHVCPDC